MGIKKHKCRGAEKIITELGVKYKCEICGEYFVSLKRKVSNSWVAQRYYQGRGAAYTTWFNGLSNSIQTGGIIMLLLQSLTGHKPDLWILPILWFIQTVTETWLGLKDYKYWKIAQNESIFSIKYSPAAIEQWERQINIEKMIAEYLQKPYKKETLLEDYYKMKIMEEKNKKAK